jgi:hypothetical protein
MSTIEYLKLLPFFAIVAGANFFYFRAVWILKQNGKNASWWFPMYNTTAFRANLENPENHSKPWYSSFKKSVVIYRIFMTIWIAIIIIFLFLIFNQSL